METRLPTLSDVARYAGVSYATADRVVNDRGGVAEKSVQRVQDAISALGYVRNIAAANLSQSRTYRFAVVIPAGTNAFFVRMREILEAERARLLPDRVDLWLEAVTAFDTDALCACLDRVRAAGADGVALVGMADRQVARKIADIREAGIAVLTLVSDVPGSVRDHYIGIDNRVAGRMAARMIGLAHGSRPGRVLPIVGSLAAPDHAARLAGLRETLGDCFPSISVATKSKVGMNTRSSRRACESGCHKPGISRHSTAPEPAMPGCSASWTGGPGAPNAPSSSCMNLFRDPAGRWSAN